ncbi:MAG TPA: tRNA (adenosine(37)-N6)-dimethylallyltransferase MiaA [Gaiellales bacterium]|jgi:tRNA dimethylallyltransferase|nr:tRNA (adenosine(37)-N6)-dimethylallyltransferase MiaA [Gaiellales bacterium]
MSRVVAIFGPTASGKSAVALALAGMIGGEIVSCDAMQAYRGLPILTNQPSTADVAAVRHHLVGIWPLDHRGSVAEFGELARAAVDDVLGRGRVPIVAGGTGLYLRAALSDMRPPAQPAAGVRERYEQLYDRRGAEAAHRVLQTLDAPAAAAVHPNDRRRVVRALELQDAGESLAGGRLWQPDVRRPTTLVGLRLPAGEGAARIADRTRQMFAAGVVEEVRAALGRGPLSETAARIHGLQDVTALIDGEIDLEEAIRRLDTRTRRYAKRQRTWMRKLPALVPLDASPPPAAVAAEVASLL